MAIPALAAAAGRAAIRYAPTVYDAAKSALSKATSGKVTDPTQVATYIGNSPQRMTVVGDALIRSGVSVDDIFPMDIVKVQPNLMAMRQAAHALADRLGQQFSAGSDKVVPAQSSADMAADIIRIKRVNAVLDVYGSEERYFLCHPNGGVPPEDFAYKRAIQRALQKAN